MFILRSDEASFLTQNNMKHHYCFVNDMIYILVIVPLILKQAEIDYKYVRLTFCFLAL